MKPRLRQNHHQQQQDSYVSVDNLIPSLPPTTSGNAVNSIMGFTGWGMTIATMVLAILIYICILSLKNNGVVLMRDNQAQQQCLIDGQCPGICPSGDMAECPALAFKAPDPTSVTAKCTSERMCHWHTIIATETPWIIGYNPALAADFHFFQQLNDQRLNEVCYQTLNITDETTRNYAESGCLKMSWQTRLWDTNLFPSIPPPIAKKRNGFNEWIVICQIHFACAGNNPAQLRFYIPPP